MAPRERTQTQRKRPGGPAGAIQRRNCLLRKRAEEATAARVAELQKRDTQRARHEAKSADEAQAIAAKLAATELRFEMKAGPTGSLFGSVTPTDIADELWSTSKIRVDRR